MHGQAWTPETDRLIADLRRKDRLSLREVALRVGRSTAATSVRLRKLGVTIQDRREWTGDEILRLRAAIDAGNTIRAIADDLDRGECSVRWKLEDLGLKPGRMRLWTPAEDARVAGAVDPADLARVAAEIGRSPASVRSRRRSLGVLVRKPWDDAEDAELRRLVEAGGSVRSISAAMGRPASSVSVRARRLDLSFASEPQAWLACEEDCLRELAGALGVGPAGVQAMARRTGRSARAVKARLKALGLKGLRAPRPVAVTRPRPVVAPRAQRLERVRPERPAKAFRPAPPAPRPSLSPDLEDAIAKFLRERGDVAARLDPERETIRLVRSRGYSVTGSGKDGFLVDGRLRLAGLAELGAFAAKRGIPVPVGAGE